MMNFIKNLVGRKQDYKKPQGYFAVQVEPEQKSVHPLIIEAGDAFLKYVSENPMREVLDSDSLVEAQLKIRRNNEIIAAMPTIVIPCDMSKYEHDLRKYDHFWRDADVGSIDAVVGENWYNRFWSYVNSKTEHRYYGIWAQQTRDMFSSQNSSQHIIDHFWLVHNLRLVQTNSKFTVVI